MNLVKDNSTLDILLSWKQENAFNYFSEIKPVFGFRQKPVLLNRMWPKFIDTDSVNTE